MLTPLFLTVWIVCVSRGCPRGCVSRGVVLGVCVSGAMCSGGVSKGVWGFVCIQEGLCIQLGVLCVQGVYVHTP